MDEKTIRNLNASEGIPNIIEGLVKPTNKGSLIIGYQR